MDATLLSAGVEGGITVSAATALAIGGGALGCITFLFKLLMNAKDREFERIVADLNATKENFEKLAGESLSFATQQANWALENRHLPPIVPVAPVVPRSQSPSTPAQRETARLQTMVAQLAQLKLAVGAEPTPAPPRATQTAAEKEHEDQLEHKPASSLKSTRDLEKAIAAVPEKTARKVVQKLEALDEEKEKD